MIRKLLIGLVVFAALVALVPLWFATLGRAPEDSTLQPPYDAASALPPPPKVATPSSEERNVFFGDLHIHTRLSLDAYRFGVTAGPEDAYVYAKGGTIEHGVGYAIRLKEPLDFAAVTDHAEYLGVQDGQGLVLPLHGGKLRETLLGRNRLSATLLFLETMAEFEPPSVSGQSMGRDPAIMRAAWQRTIDAAEQANDPGVFTSFVAYEWSAVSEPGLDNLHRNVIYRSSRAPELPFSAIDSKDAEDLWATLEAQLEEGIEAIAIPHNGNVSNGEMWKDVTVAGDPVDADYAARRARWEPIAEIFQVKGQSEAHPVLSSEDEFARFELNEKTLNFEQRYSEPRGSYARDALKRGLAYRATQGFDPFDFGVIGSSDGHGASAPIDEDAFHGKLPLLDGTAGIRMGTATLFPEQVRAASAWGSGGLAAIWAEENTRDSLFEAMRRRETFATSGTRIRVRFFAGWDYPADLFDRPDGIREAYATGVAMGDQLEGTGETGPTLAVWAVKDPFAANLDRIQIVKLWVDEAGEPQEKIFDVAASDGRVADPTRHRVEALESTVDVPNASYTNSVGATELAAVWRDPEWDRSRPTRYYARVLEIETPRWTTYDAKALGIEAPDPTTVQERAVTSAITYLPGE
ncbi:MAG: DUF3604 domain-containing protein [bacterium]|nr:DUF3604 domain-containing protein [bacterium]